MHISWDILGTVHQVKINRILRIGSRKKRKKNLNARNPRTEELAYWVNVSVWIRFSLAHVKDGACRWYRNEAPHRALINIFAMSFAPWTSVESCHNTNILNTIIHTTWKWKGRVEVTLWIHNRHWRVSYRMFIVSVFNQSSRNHFSTSALSDVEFKCQT